LILHLHGVDERGATPAFPHARSEYYLFCSEKCLHKKIITKGFMYKVAAITGGIKNPSSIYRIRVLEKYLRDNDIELTEFCPKINKYPPRQTILRPFWFSIAFLERLSLIWRVNGFDVTILQRELISTLPTLEKIIPGNKILDVDDAIYLYRQGKAAKFASEASIGVVCGNEELANKFGQWNKNISIIPTGVDISLMKLNVDRLARVPRVIGWIGTVGNLKYMTSISDSIIKTLLEVENAELRIVTSHASRIPDKLKPYARFIQWYPGVEFEEIPHWALGIMPLQDDEWSRGKCSFKLLQYLSAAIPVVASPVGMNRNVLDAAHVGHSAINSREWCDAMIDLLTHDQTNIEMGTNGRKFVELEYSLAAVAKKWKNVLTAWL
jgi:glycosyltransferase involved in cell wall biosynthesis